MIDKPNAGTPAFGIGRARQRVQADFHHPVHTLMEQRKIILSNLESLAMIA
jgi:hypothetical protein